MWNGKKEILIDGETGKFMNLFVDWLGSKELAKKINTTTKSLFFKEDFGSRFQEALEKSSGNEDNFF